jgi:hypothetical protein
MIQLSMETLKVEKAIEDVVTSEQNKHIESLRATKAKLMHEYAQAKTDLLDQIRSVVSSYPCDTPFNGRNLT